MSNQIDRFGRILFNKNKELSQASLNVDKQNSVSASNGGGRFGAQPVNQRNDSSAQQNFGREMRSDGPQLLR